MAAADALLNRLEWRVLRRLDGLVQGDYRSLFRGSGLDLAELREYQYHDDVRHIDWNVTARLQTPYVRQFHEDRETAVWLLLDLSPSMDFASSQTSKRQLLTETVGLLGRLFAHRTNRIGAMLYGGAVDRVIRPSSGRRHLLSMMQQILDHPAPDGARATRLEDLVRAGQSMIRRRSIVVLVSDFISADGWQKPLASLAARNDLTAIRLVDPLEVTLPDLGLISMQDAETGERLFVDTHDRGFRRRFEAAVAEREAALLTAFTGAGCHVLEIYTDDDLLDAMVRFLALRKGRASAGVAATGAAA